MGQHGISGENFWAYWESTIQLCETLLVPKGDKRL